jgi:hypothetical protein
MSMARASKDRPFEKDKFQRFKLIEAFRKALELQLLGRKPTSTESDPRRELTLPRYFTLFLFGLFNPMIKSMRGLCEASHFESVQKQLQCLPVSLGSFSAAQRLFDPELLKGVFEELSTGLKRTPINRTLDLRTFRQPCMLSMAPCSKPCHVWLGLFIRMRITQQ